MTGFLDRLAPRWFSIEAGRPFLADLAKGLAAVLAAQEPEEAASALILLPTRRACGELARAFVEASPGKAALLPQIRALGDLGEAEAPFEPGWAGLDLPPAISSARRRFELAALVAQNAHLIDRSLDAEAALELADALGAFLDSCQIEEVGDPDAVAGLVEGDLARHWRVSAEFLALALTAWPDRLAALGLMDINARRTQITRRLAGRWRQAPPDSLVVAAGSTGAAPSAADLLIVVAGLTAGAVVLPGLDRSLAEEAWAAVDEQHPQNGLKRLLLRAGMERGGVEDWPGAPIDMRGRWRRRLINEALRPAERTADWLGVIGKLREEGSASGIDPIAVGLEGITVTEAANEEEEAALAAVLLRETLETAGKTAALVTPDAALARRVGARLERWGVSIDSSAGKPAAAFPVGGLAGLVGRFSADPTDPATNLAILKHPLTRLGRAPAELARARGVLERRGLRGPRPRDFAALVARLHRALERRPDEDPPSPEQVAAIEAAKALAIDLHEALGLGARVFSAGAAPAAGAAAALAHAMEALAKGRGGGLGDLWGGPGGEAVATIIASLIDESAGLPEVTAAGFGELLAGLLRRTIVRQGGAEHPRLAILGVLESRLISADRLILAGLVEGVWPAAAPIDPFLSRPMRETLGLPPPERRMGLSAHDFAQAAAAPEVILLHAGRREGAPAVESRWLWRLEVLVKGADHCLPSRQDALAWARRLEGPVSAPPASLSPAARPAPTPPLAARPRSMSVTRVETWVRDPYAVYARDILRLRPLAPPDQQVDAMARGSAFHAAFERFARDHPEQLPEGAEALFEAILVEELEAAGVHETRMARERALAGNVAPWILQFENTRRAGARLLVEQSGEMVFTAPGGDFHLTARADRIEHRGEVADILDFKTGAPPSAPQMKSGLAPQLTLTGAILAAGGFADAGTATPGQLVYVRVSGGRIPGRVDIRAEAAEGEALSQTALAGLKRRIAWFDEPETPYLSWAIPQFMARWSGDYDHLARVWEWAVIGDAEIGE
jgi:ATP-dependent helicase/nuclease subunit B